MNFLFFKKFTKYSSCINARIVTLTIFLFYFASPRITAQDYKATVISLLQGLSQSSVYAISQDSAGFLCVGTQDGLNKFDGHAFTTYYNQPFDSTSISSGEISSLLHDSKARCWIGTGSYGLNLKTNDRNNFIRITFQKGRDNSGVSIKSIFEDSRGNILAGTSNDLYILSSDDTGELSFTGLATENNLRAFANVFSICEKLPGQYWIGSMNGLFLVEIKDKIATIVSEHNYDSGFCKGFVLAIKKDQSGNFWAGTSTGISVINKDNQIIRNIYLSKTYSWKAEIKSLLFSSDGKLWIASNEGLYTISADEVINIANQTPSLKRVLPYNRELGSELISITEDKINKGLIWVGTLTSGLIKLTPVTKKFYTNHLDSIVNSSFVSGLFKDSKNYIWIGTISAFIRFDRENNKYKIFRSEKNNSNALPYNYITSITQVDDILLLGSPAGMFKVIHPWSDKPIFKKIVLNPLQPEATIRHVLPTEKHLYVVLPRGIYKFDKATDRSEAIVRLPESKKNSRSTIFSSMAFDSNGNLWVGTLHGLYFYKRVNDGFDSNNPLIFYHHQNDTNSLRSHVINDLVVSSKNDLWICTSNGFSKAIAGNNKITFQNYSSSNGLKNNMVYGALENLNDHTLWLSTNGGLTKFNPVNNTFTNYSLSDGLQSNEFNGGSFHKSSDNEFFFGGVNGFSSFYPEEILPDSQPALTYITAFNLPDSSIRLNPIAEKSIELRYDQNNFSIDFIALHYIDPAKNTYSYMLDGFHSDWITSHNSNTVNFSHLSPGEYIFKVKSTNNDGIGNDRPDSLKIIIRAPFWLTWWFYALAILAILGFFWLLHRYRMRLKMQQLKQIEQIRKDIAADFHDELGHKLTTISWFSEILQNKLKPDEKELNNYLSKIKDTSGTLYHTMKDLLWAMDPAKDSLEDLYFQIREFGESLFDQTGVEFTADEAPKNLSDKNIPLENKRHVLLIFKEIMHNSFKHSRGNKVDLKIIRENNHVEISLHDNGIGFNRLNETDGYGLKNVAKRSTIIRGRINIETDKTGTRFTLELPLKN
jgi:ligand-binding sensor domain-containing protein